MLEKLNALNQRKKEIANLLRCLKSIREEEIVKLRIKALTEEK